MCVCVCVCMPRKIDIDIGYTTTIDRRDSALVARISGTLFTATSACYILSLSFSLPFSLSPFLSFSNSFHCSIRRSKVYSVLSRVLSSPPLFSREDCSPSPVITPGPTRAMVGKVIGSFRAPRPARSCRPEFGQYGGYTRLHGALATTVCLFRGRFQRRRREAPRREATRRGCVSADRRRRRRCYHHRTPTPTPTPMVELSVDVRGLR